MHTLIWISPILTQSETEGLFHWVNLHLTEARLKPLISFKKIKVEILKDPTPTTPDALKIQFDVELGGSDFSGSENAVHVFKESIWAELLAGSNPGPKPHAVSFQPASTLTSHKKLVCFDMDSTLINEEVIDEIARTAGFYKQVSEITERAMQGGLDFKTSLRERVHVFKGMPEARALAIIPHLTLSPGAEALLQKLRFAGANTVVVSGGFEIILRHFRKVLFLDQAYGNTLTKDDDENLTGEVEDPIVDAEYKKTLVTKMKENYRASTGQTVTVGDGANDIPMMSTAGVSVSFCGKPKLAAHVNSLVFERSLMWISHFI